MGRLNSVVLSHKALDLLEAATSNSGGWLLWGREELGERILQKRGQAYDLCLQTPGTAADFSIILRDNLATSEVKDW